MWNSTLTDDSAGALIVVENDKNTLVEHIVNKRTRKVQFMMALIVCGFAMIYCVSSMAFNDRHDHYLVLRDSRIAMLNQEAEFKRE